MVSWSVPLHAMDSDLGCLDVAIGSGACSCLKSIRVLQGTGLLELLFVRVLMPGKCEAGADSSHLPDHRVNINLSRSEWS